MENKKVWFGKLLTEFVSVVFAVLLALGLSHWRETAAEQKLAEKALVNIFLEIHTNQKDIQAELPGYEDRIKEITTYKANYDEGNKGKYSLGFNLPLLNNSAWNVANTTGAIKDFDLDLLMEISDLYAFQELYQDNGMAYLHAMNRVDFKDEKNIKAVLSSNLGQLKTYYAWSKQLSEGYVDFISTYGPQYATLLPDSILFADPALD